MKIKKKKLAAAPSSAPGCFPAAASTQQGWKKAFYYQIVFNAHGPHLFAAARSLGQNDALGADAIINIKHRDQFSGARTPQALVFSQYFMASRRRGMRWPSMLHARREMRTICGGPLDSLIEHIGGHHLVDGAPSQKHSHQPEPPLPPMRACHCCMRARKSWLGMSMRPARS